MSKKPEIVLIPGAWHIPDHAAPLVTKLQEAGFTVHARQLPSVGNDKPPKDYTEDIAAVHELVTKAIGEGNDVIVVPHSWGGILAGSALTGFGKKQREAKGEKGGVTKLAYMCAFIVDEGVSLLDAIGGKPAPWFDVHETYSLPKDPNVFYNDMSPEEQELYFKMIKTMSWGTFEAKATAAAWKEIPVSYLIAENDLAIPVAAQEAMVQHAKEVGADVQVERVSSGHSPFISQPDKVVAWLEKAAQQ